MVVEVDIDPEVTGMRVGGLRVWRGPVLCCCQHQIEMISQAHVTDNNRTVCKILNDGNYKVRVLYHTERGGGGKLSERPLINQ